MTLILTAILKKYDHTQDYDEEKNETLKTEREIPSIKVCNFKNFIPLNCSKIKYYLLLPQENIDDDTKLEKLNDSELCELKNQRILDKKFSEFLTETLVYAVFFILLFVVAISNFSFASMSYNKLYQNTFVNRQNHNETGLNDVKFITIFFHFLKPYTREPVFIRIF
jgi:hypothetical protein